MISFIVKRVAQNIALKVARDKNFRNKVKNAAYSGLKSAQNMKSRGELMKTLGEKAGRLKRKLKKL